VSKPVVVLAKPGNGREPRPKNRPKTWKLLKAAELRPLDPGVSQNASRLRRLAQQGYLVRRLLDGKEVFVRTDKPYIREAHDDTVFDVQAHLRRFRE
jgi:hypothetical protein